MDFSFHISSRKETEMLPNVLPCLMTLTTASLTLTHELVQYNTIHVSLEHKHYNALVLDILYLRLTHEKWKAI